LTRSPLAVGAAAAGVLAIAGGVLYFGRLHSGAGAGHTVAWYVDHDGERERVLRDCANDHARDGEPECRNALSAAHGALARALGDSVDPHFFDSDTSRPPARPR